MEKKENKKQSEPKKFSLYNWYYRLEHRKNFQYDSAKQAYVFRPKMWIPNTITALVFLALMIYCIISTQFGSNTSQANPARLSEIFTGIFVPDWVTYIGEWAFAHCSSLEKVSIYKDTFLDKNSLENSNAFLEVRKSRGNYIIESDNLYSLKGIQDSLNGKVDSILIDPPYNSNISYIGYKDSGFKDGWIHFIKDRIILARKLLTKNGFLVINIDEGERDELFDLCKTIFLEGCVSLHKWKKINPFFDKNRIVLNPNKKQTPYEYIIICKNTLESKFNSIKQPYIDGDKLKEKDSKVPAIFDCFGTTSSAKDEIQEIFGDRTYFSTPKPLKLMKELVRATTNKNSIVIDFFAGSGTTGDAVDSLNKEDKGNRSFILISNSENNICKNVTVERLNKRHIDFHFQ